MKVNVKFSVFRELSGTDRTELSLHESATVKDALGKVAENFPKFRKLIPQNSDIYYVYVLLNGKHAEPNTQLKQYDEISILPFVGGG